LSDLQRPRGSGSPDPLFMDRSSIDSRACGNPVEDLNEVLYGRL
jgi:hypothetical protein